MLKPDTLHPLRSERQVSNACRRLTRTGTRMTMAENSTANTPSEWLLYSETRRTDSNMPIGSNKSNCDVRTDNAREQLSCPHRLTDWR